MTISNLVRQEFILLTLQNPQSIIKGSQGRKLRTGIDAEAAEDH